MFQNTNQQGRKEYFPAGSKALAINGLPELEKMSGVLVLLKSHLLSDHRNTQANQRKQVGILTEADHLLIHR